MVSEISGNKIRNANASITFNEKVFHKMKQYLYNQLKYVILYSNFTKKKYNKLFITIHNYLIQNIFTNWCLIDFY